MTQSLCTHGITRRDGEVWVLPNTNLDWRFKDNPYVKNGLAFMASANINLPTSVTSCSIPSHLPVGSICIMDSIARTDSAFTAGEASVLKDLADLVAREFQLGYETGRREREGKQAVCVKELLNRSLVRPGSLCARSNIATGGRNWESGSGAISMEKSSIGELFGDVASQLKELTGADNAAILDVGNYRPSIADVASKTLVPRHPIIPAKPTSLLTPGLTLPSSIPVVIPPISNSGARHFREINVLGSSGDLDFDQIVDLNGPGAAIIIDTLSGFYSHVRSNSNLNFLKFPLTNDC